MAELTSPLAGGIRAVGRTVPSSVFTGRAVAPPAPDPVTSNLISQNSLALTSVSTQLANISGRVNRLGISLSVIKNNLEVNAALERQREQAKQNRESILAEQGLREGKEGQIERKIQNALYSPIQKIAGTTRGLLSRLSTFLFAITGAWLTNRVLLSLKSMSDKNTSILKTITSSIGTQVLVAGGLLLLTRGKVGSIKGLLSTLTGGLVRVTALGILLAPFKAIQGLLSRVWNYIAGFLGLPQIATNEKTDTPQLSKEDKKKIPNIKQSEVPIGTERNTLNENGEKVYMQEDGNWGTKVPPPTPTATTDELIERDKKLYGDTVPEGSFGITETENDSDKKSGETEGFFGFLDKIFSGELIKPEETNSIDDVENVSPENKNDTSGDGLTLDKSFSSMEELEGELKEKGYKLDDNNKIVPINKNRENNVSEKISVSNQDTPNLILGSDSASDNSSTNSVATAMSPSSSDFGVVPVPSISSSNESNNYVYTAYKHYQVAALA